MNLVNLEERAMASVDGRRGTAREGRVTCRVVRVNRNSANKPWRVTWEIDGKRATREQAAAVEQEER